MEKGQYQDDPSWVRLTARPLEIIVIGAGIGGLTLAIGLHKAGHRVTIFEQSHQISEVGAGIQLAPNAARVLSRLGMLERVLQKTNLLTRNSLRRYADNEELSTAPLMPEIGKQYGSPLGVIHRGDLQGLILKTAEELNIPIQLNHKVVKVDDEFASRVQTANGSWHSADLVVASDGIKSHVRAQMASKHGVRDHSYPTGDSAYRILIPRSKLEESGDKEALELLSSNIGMRWMGPGGHIMAYPLKPETFNGQERNMLYNMVLLHPSRAGQHDDPDQESWTNKGSKEEMLKFYSSWCPLVRNLLSYVPDGEVMEWTLNMHRPLPSWIEGNVVLMGDACHPMLPYVAQGAAQAIEDAAALTECLSQTDDTRLAIEVYVQVRKDRAEKIQGSTLETRKALHLPDGPEQRSRDEKIKASNKGGQNPDKWADKSWQEFMYGTDVMKDIRDNWEELVATVQGHHVEHINKMMSHGI